MRILGALDEGSYSARIICDLAHLCANTWADVTLLMVQAQKSLGKDSRQLFLEYANEFWHEAGGNAGPYGKPVEDSFKKLEQGGWEARFRSKKELCLRIKFGSPTKEILRASKEFQSDLIVLGCSKGIGCEWKNEMGVPQKVARDAECSVLVLKEATRPAHIISFLDQTNVSQESLELINQMVTIHSAGLKIVGLLGEKGIVGKGDVERKLLDVLRYYHEKGMNAWITLVEKDSIEDYVSRATLEGMVAIWMGKKSFLFKIFSKDLLEKLIEYAKSSVLVLR